MRATGAQPGGELLEGGDFGSLSGWQELRIPHGYTRELVEENSPFTNVYPANNSSLKLGDVPGRHSAHVKYLKQDVHGATRRVQFGIDFKILPEQSASFVIQLTSGDTAIFNMHLRTNFTLNMHIKGDSDGMWSLPDKARLEEDTWYQFQATLDMDERTMNGSIRSERGDEWPIDHHQIAINTEDPGAVIELIQIGASSGTEIHASPVLFDNITLRPVEAP